jgi:uncharacterized integral membrane protein
MADNNSKSGRRNLNFLFIIGMVLAIIIAIFAIQNAESTEVNFFTFSPNVSKVLLILFCILFGSVITLMFSLPGWFARRKEKSKLKGELKALRKKYEELAALQPAKPEATKDVKETGPPAAGPGGTT